MPLGRPLFFYKHSSYNQCIYLVYLDDVAIKGDDHEGIKDVK